MSQSSKDGRTVLHKAEVLLVEANANGDVQSPKVMKAIVEIRRHAEVIRNPQNSPDSSDDDGYWIMLGWHHWRLRSRIRKLRKLTDSDVPARSST